MESSDLCTEIDRLVEEMEAVDNALGAHLADVMRRRVRQRQSVPPLDYMRLQIKAWCAAAARRGAHNGDVLATTLMAVDQMERDDLAALVRSLIRDAGAAGRPAA